jgi:hypothetical protein
LAEAVLSARIQAGSRLVEQQRAACGERARDFDQPAIDMRQAARGRRNGAVIADESQQRLGQHAFLCAGRAGEGIAAAFPAAAP